MIRTGAPLYKKTLIALSLALALAPTAAWAQDTSGDGETTDTNDNGAGAALSTTSTTTTSGLITTGALVFVLLAAKSPGVKRVMLKQYIEHNPQAVAEAAAMGGGAAASDLAVILGADTARVGKALRAHRATLTVAMADGRLDDAETQVIWRALSV